MKITEALSASSHALEHIITRDRVTSFLQAGGHAEDFINTLTPFERRRVGQVQDLLRDPRLNRVINSGRITFAMIRPTLYWGKVKGPDSVIAEEILGKVRDAGFKVVLNMAWPVSSEAFTGFYGHVTDFLREKTMPAPDGTPSNRWDLFLRLGTEGATSFLILNAAELQRKTGIEAWESWRIFIGSTVPANAKPGTLRNLYGSEYNNIAHGSDSLESVRTDIQWMARQLGRTEWS